MEKEKILIQPKSLKAGNKQEPFEVDRQTWENLKKSGFNSRFTVLNTKQDKVENLEQKIIKFTREIKKKK